MKIRNIFKIGSTLLMGAALFVSSCSSNEDGISLMEAARSARFINDTHVTFQHVQTLVGAMRPQTRAASSEEYVFITDNDGDTLFFVVNYPEGGWIMYASDMRVPAVVAECEKGKFVLDEARDVMGNWLEAMKEDMKAVRESRDEDLNFSSEEIAANRAQWDAVCKADEFVKSHLEQTRGGHPGFIGGDFTLYETYTVTENYDSIPHLTVTRWHQHEPYNYYCPIRTNNPSCAPAGCVAIAGAQMLYYLHGKLGVPTVLPTMASCTDYVTDYPYVNMSQWNFNSAIWNYLPDDGNSLDGENVAPFIAHVGHSIGTVYGNIESSADTEDLLYNVFPYYGVQAQKMDFNADTVFASLLDSMPVIADAYPSNAYTNGHAFIIDGYKRTRMVTTYHYIWTSGESGGLPFTPVIQPEQTDSFYYEYTSPVISYIRMNWGWSQYTNYLYGNDVWMVPTGTWHTETDNGSYNFNYHRRIFYNFRRRFD